MFKSLIAGVAALGLVLTAAPERAKADGNDVLRGVIAGAIILGTIAALDDHYDRKRYRRHSHSHKHVYVKPRYGHRSHHVYRHGKRIYSDRDNRRRHDDYGYRHRDYDYKRHDGRRHGHRHDGRDRYRDSGYHSHGDYRHKNHGGHKNGHGHKAHAAKNMRATDASTPTANRCSDCAARKSV